MDPGKLFGKILAKEKSLPAGEGFGCGKGGVSDQKF
jgi:hypothetical protein